MPESNKMWEEVLEALKNKVGETTFSTWLAPLKAVSTNNQNINLEAPDQFFKDWVEKHYLGFIRDALNERGLNNLLVSLRVAEIKEDAVVPAKEPEPDLKKFSSTGSINLNSRYTFENFVIGPSNRHAHAYSLSVANSPAKTYNPLFIYGGVGLGKTHLIQAICHHIKNNGPAGTKICYVSSEKFTNELIDAILHRTTSSFRHKYRNLDVLVIDDIHFIAGKESTQEEFFHTFNALYDAHKQIVFSSDRPPKEITNLQDRLVSRFGWGLATDIQPPDLETRVAILKKKIER
ncbi:MAG: chromosomal replication initiator protein DnaA, partial [Candidatus Omnitrophica bacterium]|nr:chromosomal replication initiator protein DnaA [Candidatus Omnitrophota bacterium]